MTVIVGGVAMIAFGIGTSVGYDAHKIPPKDQQVFFACGNSHMQYLGQGKYRVVTDVYVEGAAKAVKF